MRKGKKKSVLETIAYMLHVYLQVIRKRMQCHVFCAINGICSSIRYTDFDSSLSTDVELSYL